MNAIGAEAGGRSFAAATWQPAASQRDVVDVGAAAADRADRALAGPSVAVLCERQRGPAVASAVALALAQAYGRPCAVAAAVGTPVVPAASLTPASVRAAAQLRREGLDARARGRLVWLADARRDLGVATARDGDRSDDAPLDSAAATARDGDRSDDAPLDPAAATAALSVELRRAAGRVTAPSALAIPFSRCDALDRVLAWHDAIVFVREPGATTLIAELVRASLRRLGRPVVALEAPRRLAAAAAGAGLHAPASAVAAVAELGLGGGGAG